MLYLLIRVMINRLILFFMNTTRKVRFTEKYGLRVGYLDMGDNASALYLLGSLFVEISTQKENQKVSIYKSLDNLREKYSRQFRSVFATGPAI